MRARKLRKRMLLKEANEITDILAEAIITDLPFKRGDEVWAPQSPWSSWMMT
jgi:hypothetical protein